MKTVAVPIINDSPYPLPAYATDQSAGVDLYANVGQAEILQPMERKLIPTGIKIALPKGYEAQIRPRSGLAFRHGISMVNAPGTIDADYRGEIKILLINLGQEPFTVEPGERIAQMVVAAHAQVNWMLSETLDETERGSGGFGHTGVK